MTSVQEAMASGRGVFFGDRWGAPAFEDAVEVDVPVGAVCLMCTEGVAPTDSGTFTSYLAGAGEASLEAVHIECWLRSLVGCLSHLQHRCSCYGGSEHEGTTREDARAVMEWLRTHSAS